MASAKSDMEHKREKRRAKREKIEKLTNWYMINLSWGVLGFIALGLVERLYGSASTVLTAPIVMKVIGAVFAVSAAALFVIAKAAKIKNTQRAVNYSIFLGVIALISLCIGFYSNIRNLLVTAIPMLGNLRSEWWYAWGFRYLLIIYLAAAFIVVTIKTAVYSKSK